MRNDGHLLQRVGREFVKNAIWMVVVFGALGAILVAATDLPMVGVMVFVGAFVAVLAAIMTGVAFWSDAQEDTSPGGGHSHPGSPPRPRRLAQWRLGWWERRRRWWRLGRVSELRIYPASRP